MRPSANRGPLNVVRRWTLWTILPCTLSFKDNVVEYSPDYCYPFTERFSCLYTCTTCTKGWFQHTVTTSVITSCMHPCLTKQARVLFHDSFQEYCGRFAWWYTLITGVRSHRKSHWGDKTVVRSSWLHNGISCAGKTTSVYWIKAQSVLSVKLRLMHNLCLFYILYADIEGKYIKGTLLWISEDVRLLE